MQYFATFEAPNKYVNNSLSMRNIQKWFLDNFWVNTLFIIISYLGTYVNIFENLL